MRTLIRFVLVGSCCVVASALAQPTPKSDSAVASANFKPLEFLIGHCWRGTFPGGQTTDEHCFEWVFDKKFIRDRHVTHGGDPYEGESIYSWNPKAGRIEFSYYNSAGAVMTGTVEPTAEGLVFPQRVETARGVVEMKSVWTRPADDTYHVWVGQRDASGWKELWNMDLKRRS